MTTVTWAPGYAVLEYMPPRMPPPRMAPRHLVQLLLPLLLLLAACASIVAAAPPHVLILLADDLGHTDLGYTGATVATPVIDALAKAGVMLGSFYTWNWCAPSRGAIMTGVYAPRNGYALDASGGDSGSPSAVPLRWSFLPQLLKQRGYRTVGAGKWHMGYYDRQHLPEARGFDSWFGYLGGAEDYYHHNYTSRACGFSVVDLWQADGGAGSGAFASDASYFPQFSPYMFTEHLVRKITAHGATAAAPAEAPVSAPPAPPPLFVYAALQSVHSPKQVTENYWRGAASFSRELEELCPWSETDDGHSDFDCTSQPRFQGYADGKGDNCYCQRQITLAMVRALDDSVANITAAFRTAGLWEQTVTIFMGDNGGPVNNGHSNVPFRGGKLNWWEGGIRPAAFVHSPLLPAPAVGRWYYGIIHETDWSPTILGLVARHGGLPATAGLNYTLDGVDAWPSLSSADAADTRTEVLLAHNILRRGDFKLVAGSGTDNQTWEVGMLRDCMLGTGGGWDTPPTAANGTLALCPTSLYKLSYYDEGTPVLPQQEQQQAEAAEEAAAAGAQGQISCDNVQEWGDVHDKWLCSEPCTRTSPCLYDVVRDPGERVNVAKSHAPVVEAMLATLKELRKEYYTPTQPPNNAPVDYCDTAQKNGRRVGPWLDS